jgi:hypothetical protein
MPSEWCEVVRCYRCRSRQTWSELSPERVKRAMGLRKASDSRYRAGSQRGDDVGL